MSRRGFTSLLWLCVFLGLTFFGSTEGSGAPVQFRRGDSNGDKRFDISDPITTLGFLFQGAPPTLACKDAADSNDDGGLDLTDAVYALGYLFLNGAILPPPFPDCGTDPTLDGLDCERYDADCGLFITIESPPNLAVTNSTEVDVSGTVGVGAKWVTVNRVFAQITDGTYLAAAVPLVEGTNRLSALASDGGEKLATANVQVVRDTTAPVVVITSPPDRAVVYSPVVTVTGAINDSIKGLVNEVPPLCEVGGIQVPVVNNAFSAPGVVLSPGVNEILAKVRDTVGNVGTARVEVTFDDTAVKKILVVSGDLQSARIGLTLPAPLVAKVVDEAGQPVVGQAVVFRVTQSNGQFPDGSRALLVTSDSQGRAAAGFSVGTRIGEGCNRVEATAVGFSGKAVFVATSRGGPPAKINVSGGGVQRGALNSPLPEPLGALVTDAGGNCVSGLLVKYRVVAGGGHFEVNGLNELETATDIGGRVAAGFVLGPEAGIENNQVEASIEGVAGLPAVFVATGLAPGNPADTTFSGVVLDNQDTPIPDVILSILGTENETLSDAQGQFRLSAVPVGPIRLVAVGENTSRPGSWPTLEYDVVTVSGADNTLGMPIYLLPLRDEAEVPLAGDDEDVVITLPGVPGFELKVLAHSTTFGTVKRPGKVTVTQVHSDKVPMTPADGLQPTMILTIQPSTVRFNPPAPITYPNSEGLTPGEMTEMYSFDHDLGRFVTIGPGTVSEDGSVIRSNPGFGIIKGGWHCAGPSRPTGGAESSKAAITAGKDQVVCVNQVAKFTGTGSPTPGKMEWSGGETPPTATFDTGTSTFETKFTTTGIKKVTAKWTCESGESGTDAAEVSVVKVEIEVNNTPDAKDDLVRLKSKVPSSQRPPPPDIRFKVSCRARVTGNPKEDMKVVLTNPDGRLLFPGDGDATKALTLPKAGTFVAFEVSGEKASAAKDDAIIEVHSKTADGDLCTKEEMTVFSFDPASIKVKAGGTYSIAGGRLTTTGGNAVDYEAEATLKPAGLDCTVPQLKDIRIGILQNLVSTERVRNFNAPAIAWRAGVAAGTKVSVATNLRVKTSFPAGPYNDSEAAVAPLYDQPGKATTIDANSLKPPKGCPGGGTATSNDTPAHPASATLTVEAKVGGATVGDVTYTRVNVTIDDSFRTWAVCFDVTTNAAFPLRQTSWTVNVDSAGAAGQKATPAAADAEPTHNPVTGPPFPNTLGADPANTTTAGVGAAMTEFTR